MSLHAMEQLGNLQARAAPKSADVEKGRKGLQSAIALLNRVNTFGQTVERESLLGSAYKRLALLEAKAKQPAQERAALAQSLHHYSEAVKLARTRNADNLFYPALNRMAIALALGYAQGKPVEFAAEDVAACRRSLQQKVTNDPDFWSVVGLPELRVYEALARGKLADALPGILADLDDLMPRASSSRMWGSVADQARFTLKPYIDAQTVPESERAAARALLVRYAPETAGPDGAAGTTETKVAGKRAPSVERVSARKRRARKARAPRR